MKVLMRCRQVGLSSKWELLLCVLLYSSSLPITSGTRPHSVSLDWGTGQFLFPGNPRRPLLLAPQI